MTDSFALYLAAGRTVHPVLDTAVWFVLWTLPGFLFVTALYGLVGACQALTAAIRRYRTRRHVPPAADNQPGTSHEDLWHCRHIYAASNDQPRKEGTP
ncbi:hypothetical protein ACIQMV_08510 [Streptomyces sp. NPDC091412]|uniref:hypothetical protein n=1 Tax=Streptomyces sp. NPDC091412 TaxID=3366002 RepID=UPI00380BF9EA